ncbi:MAG TPA: DNA polymerase III subunit gamma/tau [Bacillota bacterium]|nr:DNA polymerase III subunit gamma/tau [Bacillota bacterium]
MYTAIYRSFRPETFDGLLGQEHIVKILKNQINTKTTGHAYLFCGTRGTGKTSTARILAKAMNCLAPEGEMPCGVCANCQSIKDGTFMDVIEIDAASNNGVDNIRELRESVKYPPAAGRCKVYIIDEVHMLSTGAFNALLKTLEEPPENVMFILATTEVQKLPATILSRCLRLDFKRVPERILRQGMRDICGQLEVKISEAALGLIASNADGSVRDALSLLDQCVASGEKTVTRENVIDILGTAGEEIFIEMTDLVIRRQVADALLLLDRVMADGKDVRQFMKDWVSHFRSLLMTKFIRNPEDILNMSAENVERIRKQSEDTDLSYINESIVKLSQTLSDARWSTQPRILLELCIVKLATDQGGAPVFPAQTRQAEPGGSRPAADRKLEEPGGSRPTAPTPAADAAGGAEQEPVKSNPIELKPTESEPAESKQDEGEQAESEPTEPKPAESETVRLKADFDCDRLWHAVFEEGETLKGSFNLMRLGTRLKEINDSCFVVEVLNEMAMTFVKDNSQDLESLMEKHTGKRLRMECSSCGDGETQEKEKTAEDLANEIGNKFGIHIDIQ